MLLRVHRSSELRVPTLAKKGAASFVQSASTDPFTIEWYMKMTDNAEVNKDLESKFTLKDPRFHDTPTLIDFAVVFETFYRNHRVGVNNFNYQHGFFCRRTLSEQLKTTLEVTDEN